MEALDKFHNSGEDEVEVEIDGKAYKLSQAVIDTGSQPDSPRAAICVLVALIF